MSQTDNTNTSATAQTTEQALAWKRYMLKRENSLPNWLVKNSILFFFISLFACWLAFRYVPSYDLVITSCVALVLFFWGSKSISEKNSLVGEKKFLRNVFSVGLTLRILWVLYMFFVFNPRYYGTRLGSGADTGWFMAFGKDLSLWLSGQSIYSLSEIITLNDSAIDDVAYPMILGVEYLLTGGVSDVLIPYIVKSAMGAYCAVLIYQITKRHFSEGVGRIAAIFVCLNPNIIYWCGTMMKEADMVFLCCMAINKFDEALSSNSQLTIKSLMPGILYGLILLFMRMSLGLTLFMAVLVHIFLASRKVLSVGKKIVLGLIMALVLFLTVGDLIVEQSKGYLDIVQSDAQKTNMEWRSKREGGNNFAKYASATIFAPLIFTLPFPTFNMALESQLLQVQLSSGSYIKNVLSFFVIVTMLQLLLSGQWRRHVFILAYTCAYLVVLVFSGYAQSGRFHMPIWPMLMIFAAYGIQMAKTDKKMRIWFNYILYGEVLACLAWNWFKLAGRGMI